MLVEVQALVSSSTFGTARRMTSGVDPNRVALLMAVLEKRAGLALAGDDVFVNVAGGMTIAEPAADLGVAAAIASASATGRSRAHGCVRRGGPGRRGAQHRPGGLRVREAAQMGFTRCILPARNLEGLDPAGITLIGVSTLEEALDRLNEIA